MSSRRKTEARCKICLLRLEKCICAEIADARQLIHSKTPIRIIMHYKEARLPTNTGRLAKELMQDCEIWLRGAEDDTRNWEESVSSLENPIYLYPSEKAEILNATFLETLSGPPTLLLPDGNWKQASKVHKRIPAVANIKHVTLPEGAPTEYKLRHEPKLGGLATFEAIIRALEVIEGPNASLTLQKIFRLMVERTLESRRGY
ncbi:DTW domain-containing protein [bacterium]|nr:DTW domain-containing protein [bacterium]